MTWNHRVFRQLIDGREYFTIREAFYDENKEVPHSWTVDAISPTGETLEELKIELARMLRACNKPILEDVD